MRGGGAGVFLHRHCLLQHLRCLWHRGQRCLATRALLLQGEERCQRSIYIYNSLCLVCLLTRGYQFLKLGLRCKARRVSLDPKAPGRLSRGRDSALSPDGLNSPGSQVASLSFMALPQAFLGTTGDQEGPAGCSTAITCLLTLTFLPTLLHRHNGQVPESVLHSLHNPLPRQPGVLSHRSETPTS